MCDNSKVKRDLLRPEGELTWLRPLVQAGFLIASILMGLQFRSFVHSLAEPFHAPLAPRPAAVEAWLPISSLMSLTYLGKTGVANRVHPAGLVLFTLILVLTLLMRRGFCSWVCPIGTLAEYAHKVGKRLFGRNPSLPRWVDLPLRGVKYALLGFFLYHILRMPTEGLRAFIHGPYNRMADVKMYLFFADISTTALVVIGILLVLSVLFKNFWCRYLCPYGALLCACSIASPSAVRRNTEKCTTCGQCARVCPNRIPVNAKSAVRSTECTACFSCINACPTRGVLQMRVGSRRVPAAIYGVITVAAFLFAPQVARAVGYWDAETPAYAYKRLFALISEIDHPRTRMGPGNARAGLDDRKRQEAHSVDTTETQNRQERIP